MIRLFSFTALLLALSFPAYAKSYTVNHDNSYVRVLGQHAGNGFTATFHDWSAEIQFDPADLENSFLKASFNPARLITGNKMYDGTIGAFDWFNTKEFPTADFKTNAISLVEGNLYKADGELTIRDITLPLSFEFTVSDLAIAPVTATASFKLDRLSFDLGKGSDPAAEWVTKNMMIELKIEATAQ